MAVQGPLKLSACPGPALPQPAGQGRPVDPCPRPPRPWWHSPLAASSCPEPGGERRRGKCSSSPHLIRRLQPCSRGPLSLPRHRGLAHPQRRADPGAPGAGAEQGSLGRGTEPLQPPPGLCIHDFSCSAHPLPCSSVHSIHLLQEALPDLLLRGEPFWLSLSRPYYAGSAPRGPSTWRRAKHMARHQVMCWRCPWPLGSPGQKRPSGEGLGTLGRREERRQRAELWGLRKAGGGRAAEDSGPQTLHVPRCPLSAGHSSLLSTLAPIRCGPRTRILGPGEPPDSKCPV